MEGDAVKQIEVVQDMDFAKNNIRRVTAPNKTSKLALDFEKLGLGTRHKYIAQNGRYIYHIAIIDYL